MRKEVLPAADMNGAAPTPHHSLTRRRADGARGRASSLAGALVFIALLVAGSAPQLLGSVTQAGVAQEQQTSHPSPSPPRLTDMVVVQREAKSLLFALDAEGRNIFSHELTAASPASLGPADFARFFSSPEWREPTAIAHYGGKLYVSDRGAQAVFEVDINTGGMKQVLGRPHVSAPVSIAISEEGVIAVGDDDFDDIVIVEHGSAPKRLGRQLDDPDRLSFVGRDLVALDTEAGVVSLATGDPARGMAQEVEAVNNLLRSTDRGSGVKANLLRNVFRSGGRGIRDFAVYRGLYYVADSGRVIVFTPNSSYKSFPVFQKEAAGAAPSHIAVSPDYVLIGEAGSGSIRKLPRPVPVSVSFGVDVRKGYRQVLDEQHSALASLYEYLDARGLLRRRATTAARDYATPLELLRDEGVLTNWPARDPKHQKADPVEKSLAALLSSLNRWADDCKGCPAERPIRKGDSVLVPDVPVEKIMTASEVSLGPKTVREHLEERVTPEHLSQVSASYLLALNKSRLLSLEAQISRANLIPATDPTAALTPGTVIRFEAGREVRVGHLGDCSAGMADRVTVKELLPLNSVSSSPLAAALPRPASAETDKAFNERLKSLKEILISFENVVEETIGRSELNAALESEAGGGRCSQLLSTPDTYVVTTVRRAASAKYRLIGKDGESKTISEGEIARLNLMGEVDKTKEWAFTVSVPLYLGYALARVNPQADSLRWESVRQASAVKSVNSFDVFAEKQRVLRLPATVWRLSVFVHAMDFKAGETALSIVSNASGVDLLSEESREGRESGRAAFLAPAAWRQGPGDLHATQERVREYCKKLLEEGTVTLPDVQIERVCVNENRRELLAAIKYMPPLPEISTVIIGVGEYDKSVHKDHPAFSDEEGSAWYEKDGETALVPRARPSGGEAQPHLRLVKRFSPDDDHGDHVAGLIAARGGIAPGLAAGAGLYLIDSRTAGALGKSIDEAVGRVPGVAIFNFSFDIPGNAADKNQEELLKKMADKRDSVLFVVAAGNDGKDIASISERLPISWADRLPNIIGVAASHDDNLVGDVLPGAGAAMAQKGSNFGEKYVHIAAPGLNLYSVASDNSYAPATGTSQATPLVTAAAAMLYAQGITVPANIKARLVYTSDWVSQMETKVWGGLLNYRRATWLPRENLLSLTSAPAAVSAFKFKDDEVKVGEGEAYDARGEPIARPQTLRLADILRVETVAGGKLRVVYLERHNSVRKIRTLRNAAITGEVACQKLRPWNEASSQFGPEGPCQRNFDAAEIHQYVAAFPTNVIISF